MSLPKVLIQFDSDPHASLFDSMVAIDSCVDRLLRYDGVTPDEVVSLVHGAIFTRGSSDLKNTALFFGGGDAVMTGQLVQRAYETFFGQTRVSLMADPNGANTTAAAAVLAVEQHTELAGKTIVILGGTGLVGQRIAQIIAFQTRHHAVQPVIKIASRQYAKAVAICERLCELLHKESSQDEKESICVPVQVATPDEAIETISGADLVFAAGAAGVELLSADWRTLSNPPQIMVDLNAVPPLGIAGVASTDQAAVCGNTVCYGAIGVGGLKMKIHKRCIQKLFESNDQVLLTHDIYEVGKQLVSA